MLLALLLLGLPATATRSQPPAADLVVLNGKVVTLDARSRFVEAVAVRDGTFVAVGSAADVRPHVGPATRVLDAGGRTVIPGLIDSHVHALGVAGAEARQPFEDLRSIQAIVGWVREQADRLPAGTWIWTPRVFPTRVEEQRFPTL
ncbi:MAG TPA: amidohydrolase family protein, partial [Methylomirabilota bacterium]